MTTYIFDIETNGLLDTTTTIHSLVLKDADKGTIYSFANKQDTYEYIENGLKMLAEADRIIGHNIICFDLPVIKKLYPQWTTRAEVFDTLVCSRLICADMRDTDFAFRRKNPDFPGNLIGSHSLKAWGYRLKDNKDTFGETTDWQAWSKEMQDYCEQDVEVTARLYSWILAKNYSKEAIRLEHTFQEIIFQQETNGVYFDEAKASVLYADLIARREEISEELQKVFPPKDEGEMFTPKVNNKTKGWTKGVPLWKEKIVPFNPSSRDHITARLKEKYDWKPEVFTENGKPKIDDEILSKLPYPEAPLLSEYLMVQKRISQLAEGDQAWLKVAKNGKIHGSVTTNGAVTGRCTHHHPNLAQVPAVGAPYGERCRELFYAPDGYVMLGADASGLELRCLSHYMTKYDGGAYRDVILHGDIHTTNQEAAGLSKRSEAKRFIYAFLYGAGDVLLGSIVIPDGTEAEQKKAGGKLRKQFLKKTPALAMLINDVQAKVEKQGWLKGLDGRQLISRSKHSALNLLLQSAGAVVMKKATCILWDMLTEAGYKDGTDVLQVLHIHDEYQLYVKEEIAHDVGKLAVEAIRKAGDHFGFRCPLDGEYKIGKNWAQTH